MAIDITKFPTRADLEKEVTVRFGSDPSKNKESGETITGTLDDFKKFNLSERTTVYGIPCIPTDPENKKQKSSVFEKPDRGELFDSKINGIKIK